MTAAVSPHPDRPGHRTRRPGSEGSPPPSGGRGRRRPGAGPACRWRPRHTAGGARPGAAPGGRAGVARCRARPFCHTGAGSMTCGYAGGPGERKVRGAPFGECACAGIGASGNIPHYEQHAGTANRARQPGRAPLKRRPCRADGARTPRPCGALRGRRSREGGLPVRPDGGDPRRAVRIGGSDAQQRVSAQTAESPLRRPNLRGHPGGSYASRPSSARRIICKLSLCDYFSRPRLRRAISSSRRAGALGTSRPHPDVPFPLQRPRNLSIPQRRRIHAHVKASRPTARHGHGLAPVTEEEGKPAGP